MSSSSSNKNSSIKAIPKSQKPYIPSHAESVHFDPTTIGLPADELQTLLEELALGDGHNLGTADGRIALDCSIRQTTQGHYVISTTDFFFPLVDSPYLQGRIGCANVLSDLYAEGVQDCDFVLMLLAACRDMPPDQRSICTKEMVRGFRETCDEAGTAVTGGQTVLNPWPIIGGVATSVVTSKENFVATDGAKEGDVVILTKPIGTQVAVNVHQWRREANRFWKKCTELKVISQQDAEDMMHKAVCSMVRLNRNAAGLVLKHGAHACTDVTGFGILGHAQNLSENQIDPVSIELHTLPCIAGTPQVNAEVFNFRLLKGYSAETSGGLLICMPQENAAAFCKELEEADDSPCWIIGRVVRDEKRKSRITEDVKILEV